MNADEIQALVTKLVAMGLTSWGTYAGVTGAQDQAIAAGVGAGAAVLFGLYMKWNMRNVPEKAVVTAIAPTVADAKAQSAPTVAAAQAAK